MRILNIICGIAVIITTLHLAHGMHHFLSNSHQGLHGFGLYAAMGTAIAIWVLSLVGGCLLIRKA